MKQYDRQWEVLRSIQDQATNQTRELAEISRTLRQGVRPASVAAAQPAAATSQPTGVAAATAGAPIFLSMLKIDPTFPTP